MKNKSTDACSFYANSNRLTTSGSLYSIKRNTNKQIFMKSIYYYWYQFCIDKSIILMLTEQCNLCNGLKNKIMCDTSRLSCVTKEEPLNGQSWNTTPLYLPKYLFIHANNTFVRDFDDLRFTKNITKGFHWQHKIIYNTK